MIKHCLGAVVVMLFAASSATAQFAVIGWASGDITFENLTGQQVLIIEAESGMLLPGVNDFGDETGLPNIVRWQFDTPMTGAFFGGNGIAKNYETYGHDIKFKYINDLVADPTERHGIVYFTAFAEPTSSVLAGVAAAVIFLVSRRRVQTVRSDF